MSTLFKLPADPDCETLLSIIRYLRARENIDIRPKYVVEKNFPDCVVEDTGLTLMVNDDLHVGLTNIVEYYETTLGLKNLLERAENFRKCYRVLRSHQGFTD